MSGGPPHHPHNRQVPASANTAWNHLHVPNYFPRQPQLAHMSNEHSMLHQPTWHTPTTAEAMKVHPHTHMFNEMMKNESLFPKDCVDLSLARNGNQNGESPSAPISLSVRDANRINSLPPSALDIQAVELTRPTNPSSSLKSLSPGLKLISSGLQSSSPILKPASPGLRTSSPGLKSASPILKPASPGFKSVSVLSPVLKPATPLSPGLKSSSPTLKLDTPATNSNVSLKAINPSPITQVLPSTTFTEITKSSHKRSNIRVDSILERLNPILEKPVNMPESRPDENVDRSQIDKPLEKSVSVIVHPTSGNFDENSNSSSIPTSTNIRDEDTVSINSNEDSLDSNKSRRKRKPIKTIRVSKDEEKADKFSEYIEYVSKEAQDVIEPEERDPICIVGQMLEESKAPERRQSSDDLEMLIPAKTRRKTSSESETIDNIAAMVQEGLKEKQINNPKPPKQHEKFDAETKPVSVSVIKTKENLVEMFPKMASSIPTNFLTPAQKKSANTHFVEVENKLEEMFAGIEDCSDPLKTDSLNLDDSKLEDPLSKLDDSLLSTTHEASTVTSSTEVKGDDSPSFMKKRKPNLRRRSDTSSLDSSPKKRRGKKIKADIKPKGKTKPGTPIRQRPPSKVDMIIKDVYAYDSGSNASSSKSRGPFIQIKGPRDSPVSVNVINTLLNDEDSEKKITKTRKFHDDTEYRHKVRSKGFHCSTLSNKYDAQTKDATWICAFCKRGPHLSELAGVPPAGTKIPLGDLFGPYFITTRCPEFERRLDDPYNKLFKSKKITRALEEAKASGKKSKRRYSDEDSEYSDIYVGITETENKTYEIWAHEECIVWSAGTYLVGPKIVGLEEAVWTCCNLVCNLCSLKGANIGCLKRGCLNTMHFCCARYSDWQFEESTFKVYCSEHKVP